MAISGNVHWEEGLFLRPHHLQHMQRATFEQAADERRLTCPYPYGVIERRISRDELQNMLIRFDRLNVMMPSGVHLQIPGNAELPPRDIEKVFAARSGAIDVRLGVPLWYASRANTVEGGPEGDWRVKRLYRTAEVERPDENTGENAQAVRIRKVNARLLLDGEDETDLELLPLMRIVHGVGEEVGIPREDPSFVPPCMVLAGSGVLLRMVRDLANAIEASRKALLVQLTRGGFAVETMRGQQFEQMLRLRTLGHYAGRLPSLVEASGVSPFEIYLELRGMLGELCALVPDRDQFDVPAYTHDDPALCFTELCDRVRRLIEGVVRASFTKVDFVAEGGVHVAKLEEKHFTQSSEYYLGISTTADPIALARLVGDEDKFKLMPQSLTGRAVRGVKLVEERHPPLQLPASNTLHYFRLVPPDSPRSWKLVQQERALSAQWPDAEISDLSLTLYMPVHDGGDAE